MPNRQRLSRRSQPVPERVPDWGVLVFESHHTPEFYMSDRSHAFLKVIYVMRGEGELVTEHGSVTCQSGDILIVPIGQTHRLVDSPHEPMSLYALCLAERVWRSDDGVERRLPTGRLPRDPVTAVQVRECLRRLLFEQTASRAAYRSAMTGQALDLLATLVRSQRNTQRPADDSVERVQGYVHELDRRFYEVTSIDEAAARLQLSRRRFTQLFREVTGESWLNYVRQRRIGHARRLLESTDRTVVAIAFECGFNDLSSFYRAFRKVEGVSPSRYRASE